MLWIIDRITTVKVDEAGELEGLDMAIHGEAAYVGKHLRETSNKVPR